MIVPKDSRGAALMQWPRKINSPIIHPSSGYKLKAIKPFLARIIHSKTQTGLHLILNYPILSIQGTSGGILLCDWNMKGKVSIGLFALLVVLTALSVYLENFREKDVNQNDPLIEFSRDSSRMG